jgi:hypothetical protein
MSATCEFYFANDSMNDSIYLPSMSNDPEPPSVWTILDPTMKKQRLHHSTNKWKRSGSITMETYSVPSQALATTIFKCYTQATAFTTVLSQKSCCQTGMCSEMFQL